MLRSLLSVCGASAPWLGLLLGAAACQMPPPQVFSSLESSTELFAANPADIAVLPVEDATRDGEAVDVVDTIREEVARALVQRYYVPIAPAKVDDILAGEARALDTVSVLDASWLKGVGGRFGEDAALALRVTEWDRSSLMATGRVRFAADVLLAAPGVSEPLWSGTLRGEVKAGGQGPAPRDRMGRARAAAKQFAIDLIRLLPKRRP